LGTKKRINPSKVDYIEVWAYLMGLYLVYEVGDKEFRLEFQKEIEKIVKELYEEPEWRITAVEPIKYQLRLQQIFDSYETVAV